jgi:putative transcriptional regulator
MSSLAPSLLLAAPPLGDPNFDHSVVLLASHDEDGAFGWIINGREPMTVPELIERAGVEGNTAPAHELRGSVRVGGPVSPEQVWLIYPAEHRWEGLDGQFEVCDGIVATASRRVLEVVAASGSPEGFMALLGYAGWGPSQLENEIRSGAWLPTDVDPQLLFVTPRAELWQRAYERVGTSPMAFTTRVVGSA